MAGTKGDLEATSTGAHARYGRALIRRLATGAVAVLSVATVVTTAQDLTRGGLPQVMQTNGAARTTSWLRRHIALEKEPLARLVAEFNRYAPVPIEITTPSLRSLQVSGVFAIDDTESLIAFLRSLEGVRVEVTATKIRVSRR